MEQLNDMLKVIGDKSVNAVKEAVMHGISTGEDGMFLFISDSELAEASARVASKKRASNWKAYLLGMTVGVATVSVAATVTVKYQEKKKAKESVKIVEVESEES